MFLQFWRLKDSNVNRSGLYQEDLLEKFKENNLPKGNPPRMFSLADNVTKNNIEYLLVEISSKKVRVKNLVIFDHQNYIEKGKWKQSEFFDHLNYIEKFTWKRHNHPN